MGVGAALDIPYREFGGFGFGEVLGVLVGGRGFGGDFQDEPFDFEKWGGVEGDDVGLKRDLGREIGCVTIGVAGGVLRVGLEESVFREGVWFDGHCTYFRRTT